MYFGVVLYSYGIVSRMNHLSIRDREWNKELDFFLTTETFKKLVALGNELGKFNLFESQKIKNLITTFPESGKNLF